MAVLSETCTWTASTIHSEDFFTINSDNVNKAPVLKTPSVEYCSVEYKRSAYNCVKCCSNPFVKNYDCEKMRTVNCEQTWNETNVHNGIDDLWQYYEKSTNNENNNQEEEKLTTQDIHVRDATFFGSGAIQQIELGYKLTTVVDPTVDSSSSTIYFGKARLSLWAFPILIDQNIPTSKNKVQLWKSDWFKEQACSMKYAYDAKQTTQPTESAGICSNTTIIIPSLDTWVTQGSHENIMVQLVLKIETLVTKRSSWYVHIDRTGIKTTTSGLLPQGYPLSGATGKDTCTLLCPNGKYLSSIADNINNNNQNSNNSPTLCEFCNVGKYATWLSSDLASVRHECKSCESGRYQPENGKTQCYACPVGQYVKDIGSDNKNRCSNCESGKYGNNDDFQTGGISLAEHCIDCPQGKYNKITAAESEFSCKLCPLGRYNAIAGANLETNCQNCASGRYSDVQGAKNPEACESCKPGLFSPKLGAITCLWCQPGRYMDDYAQTSCKQCLPGLYSTYENIDGSPDSVVEIKSCNNCLAGYYSDKVSSIECKQCEAGKESQEAATACSNCRVGKYNIDGGHCKDCPVGYLQDQAGQTGCFLCSAGTFLKNNNECIDCPIGWFQSISGKLTCDACNIGYYSQPASKSCTQCNAGQFGFREENVMKCQACAAGRYSAAAASQCIFCDAGRYSSLASSVCLDCESGRFSTTDSNICAACPKGYLANQSKAYVCEECRSGKYSRTGASECRGCTPGMHAESSKMSECSKCNKGQYASDNEATKCLQCPIGYFAIDGGAEACRACIPGTYANNESVYICKKCKTGMFAIDYSSTICQHCPAGKIATSEGANICLNCLAGFFANETQLNKERCQKCSTGQYSNEEGSSVCTLCPKGFESSGSDMCEKCDAGTFSQNKGSSSCEKCPANWYQIISGAESCIKCDQGRFSEEGSRTKTSCTTPKRSLDVDAPIFSELQLQNGSPNVLELRLESFPYNKKVMFVVVQWSRTTKFDEKHVDFGSVKVSISNKQYNAHKNDVLSGTMTILVTTLSSVVKQGAYLRARYELNTIDIVTDWSTTLHPWKVAHHCNDEDQYLRVYPNDNASQRVLPLFSANGQPVRSCMDCPLGGFCRGDVTSMEVIPKWGYWRVPWSDTDLSDSFILCVGKDDCIGAPDKDHVIEYVTRHTNSYDESSNKSNVVDQNQKNKYYTMRKCTTSDIESNNCSQSANETCQLGRIDGGVACAVCAPNYMRSRNRCIKCYDSSVRLTIIGIFVLVALVLLCFFKLCWHSIRKYRSASRDVLRIIIVNISLFQINNSLDSMIPIQWPSSFTSWVDIFEFVDVDILSLAGGTCVSGINFFTTFATMGSLPFVILLFASLNYAWNRCTLYRRLTNMKIDDKSKRREDAYLEAFLIADEDGSSTLGAAELIKVLNVELHLNHRANGKWKLNIDHGLQLIRNLMGTQTATELSLYVFLNAVRTGKIDSCLKSIYEVPIPSNESSRDAILASTIRRNMFASSFMVAIHLLLLAHAPVSKKVFMFYLCRNINGKYYMRADYAIQCYDSTWDLFHPIVVIVLLLFTIGFPLILSFVLCWNKKRLYQRAFYAKMGFLYERYARGVEWWEIHEIMRKIMLTGILLFTSEKPMVRSVLATMICIIMCISLNFFKPHRNQIVFWVEQAANLSSTTKYLVAVVITAADSGAPNEDKENKENMGYILIAFDIVVMAISIFASIACFIVLHRSLKSANNVKRTENTSATVIHPVVYSSSRINETRGSDLSKKRL